MKMLLSTFIKQQKKTQTSLAFSLKMDPARLSRLVNGYTLPDKALQQKISEELELGTECIQWHKVSPG